MTPMGMFFSYLFYNKTHSILIDLYVSKIDLTTDFSIGLK